MFIGHPDYIHQGLGSHILRKFLREVVFTQEDIRVCVIDPQTSKTATIRAYEKVGFRFWKIVPAGTYPDEPEGYWLRVYKDEFMKDQTL